MFLKACQVSVYISTTLPCSKLNDPSIPSLVYRNQNDLPSLCNFILLNIYATRMESAHIYRAMLLLLRPTLLPLYVMIPAYY